MRYMKILLRIVVIGIMFTVAGLNIYADEISDAFTAAQTSYKEGNYQSALNQIARLKSSIEQILNKKTDGKYEEVSWDRVKILPNKYVGKRIKVVGKFFGINSDGTILVFSCENTFEDSLTDQILSLVEYKEYTFYGIVKKDQVLGNPYLHIERIE